MALVERRERGVECDLLPFISGVDLNFVVVDPDSLIRVFGEESELDGGVEEVGVGEVKLVDISFFEGELRL